MFYFLLAEEFCCSTQTLVKYPDSASNDFFIINFFSDSGSKSLLAQAGYIVLFEMRLKTLPQLLQIALPGNLQSLS